MNWLRKLYLGIMKKDKSRDPEDFVKFYYEYYTGKKLNLSQPVEFNEKIQWLKVFYQRDLLTILVDKYAVREYVKKKIGEQYLNELYGVYNSFGEIPFDDLPNQFVIKGTHGCNYNLIVENKEKMNLETVEKKINKWLLRNYYYRSGLEWAYKNVPRRIIIEKYLSEGDRPLRDFKFFCFNGKPKFIQIDQMVDKIEYRCFYNLKWEKQTFQKGHEKIQYLNKKVEKPSNLEEMIKLAEILAKHLPFVRVDFYSIFGKTIFGEMTFYPSDGRTEFVPDRYNKIFGEWIKLPEKIINNRNLSK